MVRIRARRMSAVSLAVAIPLLAAFPGAATAHKIVGHDGMIHACYRVKGKPKGVLRAVHGRAKCHRGERKVTWPVAAMTGQAGAAGQTGPAGQGVDATTVAALDERINALAARVEKLEGLIGAICPQVSLLTSLLPIEPFTCP